MNFRVTTWRHVFAYSFLITALAVAVPLIVVSLTLFKLPFAFKLPILIISGLIPVFIAFPISIFGLYMFKLLHETTSKIEALVNFDPLTGLLSRARFLDIVAEHRSAGGALAVLDADHFKKINDTYGHDAGDEALKFLALHMQKVVNQYGVVGRLGGEEFGIYFPGLSLSQAKLLISTLGSNLRANALAYRNTEIRVSVSAGLVHDNNSHAITGLLRTADKLLYFAKRNGRDQCATEEPLDQKAIGAA